MSTEATKEVIRYQTEAQVMEAGARFKQQVEAIKITSQDTFNQTLAMTRVIKSHYKEAVSFFDGTATKPGPRKKAQIFINKVRGYLRLFEDSETACKDKMRAWERAEEKKRQEQEAAAAKKRAAAAEEARKNGDEEKAERIETVLPPQRDNRAHAPGTAYVDNWKGRLAGTDEASLNASMRELIKAVLAEKAPASFLTVDWSEVNKFARATSGKMPVAGLEFYNDNYMKVGR